MLACWKIVAGSERDMAYATMLVRVVYFITGTADSESWEGCHGQRYCIIYSPIYYYLCGLLYYVQGTDA